MQYSTHFCSTLKQAARAVEDELRDLKQGEVLMASVSRDDDGDFKLTFWIDDEA